MGPRLPHGVRAPRHSQDALGSRPLPVPISFQPCRWLSPRPRPLLKSQPSAPGAADAALERLPREEREGPRLCSPSSCAWATQNRWRYPQGPRPPVSTSCWVRAPLCAHSFLRVPRSALASQDNCCSSGQLPTRPSAPGGQDRWGISTNTPGLHLAQN